MNTTDVLKDRGATYGSFQVGSEVVLEIKKKFSNMGQTQSIIRAKEMIAEKLCRALLGDASHLDNYVDISGYARLGKNEVPKNVPKVSKLLAEKSNRFRNFFEAVQTRLNGVVSESNLFEISELAEKYLEETKLINEQMEDLPF